MRLIPKIKEIKIIYKIKIKVRSTKYLLKNVFYLIFNKTKPGEIVDYIKNFFKKVKININRDDFYKEKYFDHSDWFTHKVPLIMNYFNNINKNNIVNILEVGSWEGRSTCFFLNYFKNSKLTCVDTWEGSSENFDNKTADLNSVEENFDKNIFEFKNRVMKNKMRSEAFFQKNQNKFDFIYIDGSHYFDDVLNDAKEAFKILKKNSYMLFDDYDWFFYKNGKNPINAINLFLKSNKKQIEIIYVSSQVLIKKTT